ncbi:hypothetical protein FACS189462_0880 [Spirochaetia bacterium]|nr:hypothetical protein FACS189462_0880 [Spirochaetia bacterium]
MMKKNREDGGLLQDADYIVTFLCLIGAFLCLYFFWLDFNHTLARREAPVGTISWKYKTAQRRFTDRVLWDRLKKNTPVYNGDYIRTAGLSEAAITFIGGNVVDLDENTLIEIFAENGKPRLDLMRGDLAVNTTSGSVMILRAGGNIVNVDDGTVLNTRMTEEGNLNLSVSEGSAALEAAGETRHLAAGDALSLDSGGFVFDTPQTVMLSPKPAARLVHSGENPLQVEFAWKGVNYADGDRTRIDIAADWGFTRILHSLDGAAQDRMPAELAPGAYYWRAYPVSMTETVPDAAEAAISTGRLTIVSVPAPKLLSPAQDYNYQYRSRPPAVKFQWTASPEAALYLLEAADNPGLENPALREFVQGGTDGVISFNFTSLGRGRWYWWVIPVLGGEYEGRIDHSATASFTITQSGNLAAPALLTPRPDAVIGSQAVYFSWQVEAEAESYTLLISPEADLRNPVIIQQTAANYYSYGTEELPLGEYYWGVYQTGSDGTVSAVSPARSFTFAAEGPFLRSVFPPDNYFLSGAELQDMRFTWRTNLSESLLFQVSNTQDFSAPVINEAAVREVFQGRPLGEGRWYWRIAVADGNMQSPVRSFEVVPPSEAALLPPYLIAPRDEPIAARTDAAAIFSWRRVEGADYYNFSLHQKNGNGTAVYSAPFITNPRLELPMRNYPEGPYTWTVEALAQEKAGAVRPSASLSSAEFYLRPLLPEARLRRPGTGFSLGPNQLLESRTITFIWDSVPGANSYVLILYRDGEGGRRRLLRRWENLARTSFTLDDLSVLENGGIIWQVEGRRLAADGSIEQWGIAGENRFTVDLPALRLDIQKNPGTYYGQ